MAFKCMWNSVASCNFTLLCYHHHHQSHNSSFTKQTLYPLTSDSSTPAASSHHTVSLWVWLLQILHLSGIIQYLFIAQFIATSLMVSSFIHVVACVRLSILFFSFFFFFNYGSVLTHLQETWKIQSKVTYSLHYTLQLFFK